MGRAKALKFLGCVHWPDGVQNSVSNGAAFETVLIAQQVNGSDAGTGLAGWVHGDNAVILLLLRYRVRYSGWVGGWVVVGREQGRKEENNNTKESYAAAAQHLRRV